MGTSSALQNAVQWRCKMGCSKPPHFLAPIRTAVGRAEARKNARNFRIVQLDRIPTPSDHPVGGALHFGPHGKRYLGVGDGGTGGGPAQSLRSPLGKVLRIDPDGPSLIPADNPFVHARGHTGLSGPWGSATRSRRRSIRPRGASSSTTWARPPG